MTVQYPVWCYCEEFVVWWVGDYLKDSVVQFHPQLVFYLGVADLNNTFPLNLRVIIVPLKDGRNEDQVCSHQFH